MTTQTDREQNLVRDIVLALKAAGRPVPGELWLSLVFRTESELTEIARELHLQVS